MRIKSINYLNFKSSFSQVPSFHMAGTTPTTHHVNSEGSKRRYRVHPQIQPYLNIKTFNKPNMPDIQNRRCSLQTVYTEHPLSNIAKFQTNSINTGVIHKRNKEVMTEIVDYMKKLHGEAVFKRNYAPIKDAEINIEEPKKKKLERNNTIDGLKRWALLREQYKKQKQVCISGQSEVR